MCCMAIAIFMVDDKILMITILPVSLEEGAKEEESGRGRGSERRE